jgi:hypothetical protein
MSVDQADIERIVREVMAQLKHVAQPAAAPAPLPTPQPAPAVHSSDLVIDSRIVTLDSIVGRLNGAKQIIVPPGALVTPSVRDELRRRGVELRRETAAKEVNSRAPVLLVVGRTSHDPDLAVRMLRHEGIDVRTESTHCLIKATEMLAAAAAARLLGVLWTRHTAIAMCLANRQKNLRAVLAAGVPTTAAAAAAVGANVLVIDPTTGTMYERKQVLRAFCLGGIRECPEELKEVLELKS